MHLTTIVSLLAAGAAAAPARPFSKVAPSTLSKVALPSTTGVYGGLPKAPAVTNVVRRQDDGDEEEEDPEDSSSSSSSSSAGLIPGLPGLPLRRRQDATTTAEPSFRSTVAEEDSKAAAEAEEDPLDAYLQTLKDGEDYDEETSEKALDNYHESLEEDKSNSTTSAITTSTSVAAAVEPTVSVEAKNATSSDSEKLIAETEAPKNETTTELAAKTNETSSAVPEPTKKALSKDPVARLKGALNGKRQDIPELPTLPTLDSVTKRQLGALLGTDPETEEEDTATPDASEKNATTSAVPAVEEKNATTTTTDAQNVTSSAVDNTTAEAEGGFYGINKHMAKLSKLPIGLKRDVEGVKEAVPDLDEEELATPEVKQENITAPATPAVDEKPIDSHATAANDTTSTVNGTSADAASTTADGYKGINKHMSKLDKLPLGLRVKRQESDFLSTPVDAPTDDLPTEPELDTSTASFTSTEADSPLYKYLVPLERQHEKPAAEVTAAAPSEPSEEADAAAPVEKRQSSSKTTVEEVSPDADAVEDPEAATPDVGLNGLLGGLA